MPPTRPLADRFWEKVDKSPGYGPWGNCWRWTASHGPKGYGSIGIVGQKTEAAHRVSFKLAGGVVPKGEEVMHSCNVRDCVRPEHLRADTHHENVKDKTKAGTQQRGTSLPNAKLTEEKVLAARHRIHSGEPIAHVAREIGIDSKRLSEVARGLAWPHVGGPRTFRGRRNHVTGATTQSVTDEQAEQIRREVLAGGGYAEVGKRFGISVSAVNKIVCGVHHMQR